MRRVLAVTPPLLLIIAAVITFWLDETHRVEVTWANGLGITLLIIGGSWLPLAYRRLGRSPVKVGVDVKFMRELHTHVGTVVAMRGDMCTVQTAAERFEINRYDLVPV
ncbi:MAG: hypothetical protein ACO1OB_27480 [Archangium sp.]